MASFPTREGLTSSFTSAPSRGTASSPSPKAIASSSRSFKVKRVHKQPTSPRCRDPARTVEAKRPGNDRGVCFFVRLGMRAPEPMYATIGATMPAGDDWTFEQKYDGMRVIALVSPRTIRLVTRNGREKAEQF